MSKLSRQLLTNLYTLCTGYSEYRPLDEDHYRKRLLVTTSMFFFFAVSSVALITYAIVDLRPEGKVAADIIFLTMIVGSLLSMCILRLSGSRNAALNVLIAVLTSTFTAACLFFGGPTSPTFIIMMLAPVMAAVAGSLAMSVSWAVIVLVLWVGLFMAERMSVGITQIIAAENIMLATLLAHAATATVVISVVLIYAEVNKALRTSLQESNQELMHLSSHDQLTSLPNRRFYDERMSIMLHRAAERGTMVGLLIIDLNNFKKINDSYGHGAGDKLLTTVAHRIQANLRETDLVARLGGDEFVAVLEDVKSPEHVRRIAQKLSQAIEQSVSVRRQEMYFSASIGVSLYPLDGRQKEELEEQADKAMYLAKKRGTSVALSSLEDQRVPWPVKPKLRQI